MANKRILVFEDDPVELISICKDLLEQFAQSQVTVSGFQASQQFDAKETFEGRLVKDLAKNFPDTGLIICDLDLHDTVNYPGMSENNVSAVADLLAIPICIYARRDTPLKTAYERLSRWTDQKIILDFGTDRKTFVNQCGTLYKGFRMLQGGYVSISEAGPRKRHSISDILAEMLERRDIKDRLALYGSGDKQMLGKLLPFSEKKTLTLESEIQKRIPLVLGYWLWNSILRFPGLLVNRTAAASYLNIDLADFDNPKVQVLFQSAEYKGPFSGMRQYWWRDELDNILLEARYNSGLEFVKSKGIVDVKMCACSVDPSIPAGCYCMITEKPVSAKHSRSNISWFPAGADLARISTPKFEELAPWLELD